MMWASFHIQPHNIQGLEMVEPDVGQSLMVWRRDMHAPICQKKTPQLINTLPHQSSNSHGAKSDGLAARHARPNLATNADDDDGDDDDDDDDDSSKQVT